MASTPEAGKQERYDLPGRRVCIIQSVLKQYRVPFYLRLADRLKSNGIELAVIHGEPNAQDAMRGDNVVRPEACFRRVESTWLLNERLLYQRVGHLLNNSDYLIVEHATKYISNYPLIVSGVLGHRRIALWGHGRNRQSRGKTVVDLVRRWLIKAADWYFAYTAGTRDYVASVGMPVERITVVQNATDTSELSALINSVGDDELRRVRHDLGIPTTATVGLFVGSLYADKLLALLIDSATQVKAQCPDFHLVIAGAGPESGLVRDAATQHSDWLHYVGPRFGRDRAVYFRMASLFLNPGLVGLSILDAFAAGLPVITTDFPYHSPEIEYLVSGLNGVIAEANASAYASSVIELLGDGELIGRLRQGAVATANSHSMEAMVDNFHEGILSWMAASRGGARRMSREPRVVLLTNIVTNYRLPDYLALSRLFPGLTILLSRKTVEENLAGSGVDAGHKSGLDVRYMRSLSFRQRQRHGTGFVQDATILLPYDTIPKLRSLGPDVIVSSELGFRSLQASLYRRFKRSVRLIVHADLSERTELGRGFVRGWMRRFILSRADAVLVNGEGGRRYVTRYGVPTARVFSVPYSTQPGTFLSVDRHRGGESATTLLYVGQFIPRKGLLSFLHQLSRWCSDHPARQVRWILVGQGESEADLRVLRLPQNLSLDIRPPVKYEELPAVYAEGDIFVLPTLADTWALVVNEAMLSGMPVLGSIHSQAVAELVRDGTSGWVFDPEEGNSVVAALSRSLKTARPALVAMGQAGREQASQLTPELVANAYKRAIDFVTGSSHVQEGGAASTAPADAANE